MNLRKNLKRAIFFELFILRSMEKIYITRGFHKSIKWLARLLLVVVFTLQSVGVRAQVSACQGGVLTMKAVMTAIGMPAGQQKDGIWTNTAGLNFSSLTDPDALVSGFVSPNVYVVTWKRNSGQSYNIIISANANPLPAITSFTANTVAGDLLLCSKINVALAVLPNTFNTYEYFVSDKTTAINTSLSSTGSNAYNLLASKYNLLDKVFTVVTAANGCKATTALKTVSSVDLVQVKVVGGLSVCTGAIPPADLEVLPYNQPGAANFVYTWTTPSGLVVNQPTVPITSFGDYSVSVSNTCGGGVPSPTVSNTVSVRNITLPDVTLNGGITPVNICGTATDVTMNTVLSAAPTVPIDYEWRNSGTFLNSGAAISNYTNSTQPIIGSYQVTIREQNNADCYRTSNIVNVQTSLITASISLASPPSGCSATPYTPQVAINVSGGQGPWDVTITNSLVGDAFVSVPLSGSTSVSLPAISAANTYTYTIKEVKDATGCAIDITNATGSAVIVVTAPATPYILSTVANLSKFCSPTSVTLRMLNAEAGVTYVVRYNNGATTVDGESITPGVNGAFIFPTAVSALGTYTVVGRRSPCSDATMAGSVSILATPSTYNIGVVQVAPLCSGNNYNITLSNSQTGVTYTLLRGATVVTSLAGTTGLALTFTAQTTAGTYMVSASNGTCAAVTMTGAATVNPSPTAYNITGGNGCSDSPVTIGISDSEAGIQYDLYLNSGGGPGIIATNPSAPGGPFVFGSYSTVGTYTVRALNTISNCTTVQSGSIVITEIPNDEVFTNTGILCDFATVALNSSQIGVSYQLRRNGLNVGVPLNGTGAGLSFGSQSIAGIYTVYAVHVVSGCNRLLSNTIEVQEYPITYNLSANKLSFCTGTSPTGVVLSLNNSETGVSYQFRRNGLAYGGLQPGLNGNPLTWSNIPDGLYSVIGNTSGGCSSVMSGTPSIIINPLPNAIISLQGATGKCQGAPGTFLLNVALSGTAPYNFTIIDDKGNSWPINGWATNVYTQNVNPLTTTTYSVQVVSDNTGCSSVPSATATVNIFPNPSITFTGTTAVCLNSSTTITAAGSGAGGSYIWSTGANTAAITVAPTVNTNYNVIATTSQGCTSNSSVPVTVNPLPVVSFTGFNAPPTYCTNNPAVTLTGVVNGLPTLGGIFIGNGITGTQFTPSLAPIGPSNIFYSYTDGNGCSNTSPIQTVWVNSLPVVNINQLPQDYCADQGAVTLNGSPQSTSGVFQILTPGASWADNLNGTMRFTPSGSIPGTGYSVRYTFTDGNGCVNFIDEVATVLTDYNNGTSFTGLIPPYCQNQNVNVLLNGRYNGAPVTGTFTFTGPAAGLVNHGNGTATFNPSLAGNGTHTITFAYTDPLTGCVGRSSQTITIGTALTVSPNSIYCKSDASFLISGLPAGGSVTIYDPLAPATPLVSGPDNTVLFNPAVLPAGNYPIEYTFTDVNGCPNSRTWNVNLVALPNPAFATPTGLTQFCRSKTNVILLPTQAGGFFSGIGVSGNVFNPSAAAAAIPLLSGMASVSIPVTYTINTGACVNSSTINLVVNNFDDIWIDNLAANYCDNSAIIPIQASNLGIGGAVYAITSTKNAINVSPVVDNNNGTAIFNPALVGPGIYTVTYQFNNTANNGCISSYSKVVRVYPALGVNFGGLADPINYCKDAPPLTLTGSFVGTGTFTGVGGFTGTGITDVNPNDGIAIFNPADPLVTVGNHAITFTYTAPVAQGSCVSARTKTISILESPTKYNITPTILVPHAGHYCEGAAGVVLGVDNTQNGVTYELLQNGNAVAVQTKLATGIPLTFNTSVTSVGNYTVRAKNVNGCTSIMTNSVDVSINKMAPVVVAQNASCNGADDGKITVTASGGSLPYVYSIDAGATWSLSNVFPGLAAPANYPVTVKDDLGCTITAPIATPITEPTIALNVSLVGTTIPAGCVPCTAGVDCEGSALINITGGTPFAIPLTYPDGYKIEWKNGAVTFATTKMVMGLAPGAYTVEVTDKNGCYVSLPVVIGTLPALTLVKNPGQVDNVCFSGTTGSFSVSATGGSTVFQFSKDDGANFFDSVGNTYSFTSLPAGTYKVWVRDKAHPRCKLKLASDVVITEPPQMIMTLANKQDVTCFGVSNGSFDVTTAGGLSGQYDYSNNGGTTWEVSGSYSGLTAATYNVRVRDRINPTCISTSLAPIVITQPAQINVAASVVQQVSCFGGNNGSVTAIPSGGNTPYGYVWVNTAAPLVPISTNQSAVGLIAGSYRVTATDAKLCAVTSNVVTITQPSVALNFSVTQIKDIACPCGVAPAYCEGSATIQINGGSPGYTILWSSGGTGLTENTLGAGNYSVTVTDSKGCVVTQPFTIGQLAPLNLVEDMAGHVNVLCNGSSTGAFRITASGGSGDALVGYQYSLDNLVWTAATSGTYTFTNKIASNYTVYVRDALNTRCSYAMLAQAVITQPAALGLTEITASRKSPDCFGTLNGEILVSATGGSSSYQYSRNGGAWVATPLFTGLASGGHLIRVRDALSTSCVYSGLASIPLTAPVQLNLSVSVNTPPTCFGSAMGSVTLLASGGTSTYNYSRDGGGTWQASKVFSGLIAGVYSFSVRDVGVTSSCQRLNVVSATITQPADFSISENVALHKNVSCISGADGSFTVSQLPVGANLSFSINGGTTWLPATFSGLTAGTYQVSVKNNTTNCEKLNQFSVSITEPAALLQIASNTITPVTCPGGTDGAVLITVFGGTLPYNYTWTNTASNNPVGGNNDNPVGLSGGTYRVLVKDATGICSATADYVVSTPSVWSVTAAHTNVSVVGGSDGTATLSAIAGGTPPYVITWADGAGAFTGITARTSLSVGTYTYTITDSKLCSTSGSIIISEGTALSMNANVSLVDVIKCFGESTGAISISTANGVLNYKLDWNAVLYDGTILANTTVANIPTVYNLSTRKAGTYNITVTDNNGTGASITRSVVITQPAQPIVLTALSTDVQCNGGNNGSITFSATGGTVGAGGYKLDLIPGYTGNTGLSFSINTLSVGGYTAWVTDDNGCTKNQVINIAQPAVLSVAVSSTPVTCNGGADGSLTAVVSGRGLGNGYNYDWEQFVGAVWVSYLPNTTPTISGLSAGTYRVIATSASDGCTVTSAAKVVTQPVAIAVLTTLTHITQCNGDNSGAIYVEVSGGMQPYNIDYGDASNIKTGAGPWNITNLLAGNYNLIITDVKGCTINKLVQLNEPTPFLMTVPNHSISCSGVDDGVLNFTLQGGNVSGGNHQYYMVLSNSAGYNNTQTVNVASGLTYAANYTNLPEGDYTLTVRDNYATPTYCEHTYSFELKHIVITGTIGNTTCSGVNSGSITPVNIAGTSGNYTYVWSTLDGSGLNGSTLTQGGLSAGTYKLTVTDVTRICNVGKDFIVTNSFNPTIDATVKNVTCAGGKDGAITNVVLTGITTPVDYSWSGPSIVPATMAANQQTNLAGGTYNLVITDSIGCSKAKSFDVIEPPLITYSISTVNELCKPYLRGINLTGLSGGTVPLLNYSFNWSGPGSTSLSTQNLTGLTVGGTYTVVVRDEDNCAVSKSITLAKELILTETVSQLACNGAINGAISIAQTGGVGPFTYAWTKNGLPYAITKDLSNLSVGNYHLIVTDLGELFAGVPCIRERTVLITQPSPIIISASLTHLACNGGGNGKIVLTAIGGTGNYSYAWSSGNGTGFVATAKDQSGLSGGTYSVVVKDDNNCIATTSFTMIEPLALAFDLDTTQTACNGTGGQIQIINQAGGSGSFSYTWGGPGILPAHQNATNVTGLISGNYTITMTDLASGGQSCSLTKITSLIAKLNVTAVPKAQTCGNIPDGNIEVTVTGGIAPFTYDWTTTNGGGLTLGVEDQYNISSGDYHLKVTDNRSCVFDIDLTVGRQSVIQITDIITPVLCFGNNTGAINITVSGGTGSYTYSWTGTGVTLNTEDQAGRAAGSYTLVVVDDATGCQETRTYIVPGPMNEISVTSITVTPILCKDEFTGGITIAVTGGTPFNAGGAPFYNYSWTGPMGSLPDSPVLTKLRAGDYRVTITDANGCQKLSNVINVPEPLLKLNASVLTITDVTAFGGADGEIEINVIGGTGAYIIVWSGVNTLGNPIAGLAPNITHPVNLVAGTYQAIVTDLNGCSVILSNIIVRQPGGALVLTVNSTNIVPCNGDSNGTIRVDVTGGVLPYTIEWFNSSGLLGSVSANSKTINNLTIGQYLIKVTDANTIVKTQLVNIIQPITLGLSATATQNVNCYAESTGSIRASIVGGSPLAGNYKLEVLGPGGYYDVRVNATASTNYDYTNLISGDYTIRVTDDGNGDGVFDLTNDCSKTQTVTITQPKASVVLSDNEIICIGIEQAEHKILVSNWLSIAANPLQVTLQHRDSNGSFLKDSIISVNSSPYIYRHNPIVSEIVTITAVKNAAGTCNKGVFSGTVTVNVKPLPTATIRGNSDICLGETTTMYVDLTGSAPWSFVYTDGITNFPVTTSTTPYEISYTPVVIGTSTFTVLSVSDKNTCANTGVGSAVIKVNPLPGATLSGNADICKGSSTNLTFTITTGSAPWMVTYTEKGVTKAQQVLVSPYVMTVAPIDTTAYKLVSVSDANGCDQTAVGSILVTVRPLPENPIAIAGIGVVCQGQKTVVYNVPSVKYAVTYIWDIPVANGFTLVSGAGSDSITVDIADNATAGTIRVHAENGCGSSTIVERLINVNPLPNASGNVSGPTSSCQGSKGLVYTVSSILNASTYNWLVPAGYNIVSGNGSASIIVDLDPFVDVMSGVVTVYGVNACGDGVASLPYPVIITSMPTANAGYDEHVCSSIYTLKATPVGAGFTGTWKILSGSGVMAIANINNEAAPITNLSQGENKFEWSVVTGAGCEVKDTVSIFNDILTVNASAGSNTVCNDSTTIAGTNPPSGVTGLWTFDLGNGSIGSASSASSAVTGLAPDVNTLRWTLTKNGCLSFATVQITNNEPSAAVIQTLNPTAVCGTTVTLIATAPLQGIGLWTRVSGSATIVSPNSAITNVTGLSKGNNKFAWTVSKNGCSKTTSVTILNNQLTVTAGSDQILCTDQATLAGTPLIAGVTGSWRFDAVSGGSGVFNNSALPGAKVTALGQGNNYLIWELNQSGCLSSDTVKITSNRPTIATTGSLIKICADTARLVGNAPVVGSGFWSVVSGSGRFVNPTDPNSVVRGLNSGTNVFRWTITINGCSLTADQTVKSLFVSAYAGKDTSICEPSTTLHANPIVAPQTGAWFPIPGLGSAVIIPGPKVNEPQIVGLTRGSNSLEWTVTNEGCISRDTVIITNNTATAADAGADQALNGTTTTLSANSGITGEIGTWNIVSGGGSFVNRHSANTQVSGLLQGDNFFRWTIQFLGCSSSDEVKITNGQTDAAEAGLDQETCSNSAQIKGNLPTVGIGQWTIFKGSGKFDKDFKNETRVYDLGVGRNVLKWTIYYAASSSEDTVVIINSTPTKADAGPDRIICVDNHIMEGVNPSIGTEKWSLISGGGVFVDANLHNSNVTGLAKGMSTFKYEISNSICKSIDTVLITNGIPTIPIAGLDEVICTDSVELKPNNPTFGTGEWRVGEGSADFVGNWAKKLAQGNNKLVWVVSTSHCSLSDTIDVTNNKPATAFAGFDRIVCVPNVQLSANVPLSGNGTWTLLTGAGTIVSTGSAVTNVTGLNKGANRFRWTINNSGCISTDDVEINNNLIEAFAGYDQVNCADTAMLVANNPAPGVGTWGIDGGSGTGQFNNLADPYTTVRSLDRGDNVLSWTVDYGGCSSVSKVTVTNNNPTFPNAGPNVASCINSITLSANEIVTGSRVWTQLNGSGTIANVNNFTTQVTNLAFGKNIFRWTATHMGCVYSDDVEIAYNTIPAAVGPNQPICSNTTTLSANNATPGEGFWSVIGGTSQAEFANISNPNTIVSNLARGVNNLRWTIRNQGCESFADMTVTNNSPSISYAGNNQEICLDNTILDATAVAVGAGHWDVLTGSGTITNPADSKSTISALSKGDNIFRWTVQNGTCFSVDEVLIVNNRPSMPYAGANFDVCTNSGKLKADSPEYGQGLWSIVTGYGTVSNSTSFETLFSNLGPGLNTFRWTITQGQCVLFDEIDISNSTPTKAMAGPDIQDCKDFVILDANVPLPNQGIGYWGLVSGKGTFEELNNPKTKVSGLGFGENQFMWRIENGSCFSTDLISVFNKVPDQAGAGSERTICDNYLVLNANNPNSGTGSWSVLSGAGTFEDRTRFDTKVTNVGFGENYYKWTISYGDCTTESLVKVVSNKSAPYAGEDENSYTSTYSLRASNPGKLSGVWSIVGGTGTFADATFFNTVVTNLTEGVNTFRWSMNVNGCLAYDDVSIHYKIVPEAGFIVDSDNGCYPLSVQFTNYSVGGTSYVWEFGNGNTSAVRNPNHIYTQPGEYISKLTVPGPDGKDAIFTKKIVVHDHPVALFDVTPSTIYVPGDVVRFYNLSKDGKYYLWNFGDGTTSEVISPLHEYQEEGVYDISLTVKNLYQCSDMIEINDAVTALAQGFITFPNAFKPRPGASGSGVSASDSGNETFKPVYRDVSEYHLQIYNRWGQMIFETSNIDEGWNGLFNNVLAPQDVYVYKAWGKFNSGKEYRSAGNVMLVR